jgi:putative membrane protein
MSRPRFPRRVYDHGTDPDPRFSLANERTFLAWIRTALALLAGGVALAALPIDISTGLRIGAVAILLGLGLAAPIYSWIAWMRNERALREANPLHAPSLAVVIIVGLVLAGGLVATGLLL